MRIGRGGSFMWIVQAVSGFGLTALLTLHMVANHFVVEGGLRTYQDVLAYLSHPTVFILEIIFLLVVVPHAFLGLRAILIDLGPRPRTARFLDAVFVVLGTAMLLYGIALFTALRGRI